jgi:protein TonB
MLIWAIAYSILFHGLLVLIIPNLKFDSAKKIDFIEIQLSEKKPEPPPVILPEPIKPLPTAIKPKLESKTVPVAKIPPVPTVEKNTDVNNDVVTQPQPSITKQQPEVIAVAPKVDAPPPSVAIAQPEVAPEQSKPTGPSQTDIDVARGRYGNSLWSAIEKHKNYPRIAQMRGWQGDVIVELLLDGNGKLKSKKVIQSSGYDSLDKQALEMADKASPFPAPPEVLRGSIFSIKVPIPFKLESQ